MFMILRICRAAISACWYAGAEAVLGEVAQIGTFSLYHRRQE